VLKNARFLADFSVTAKKPKWQCAFKYTLKLEFVIVLLDAIQHSAPKYTNRQTDTGGLLRSP